MHMTPANYRPSALPRSLPPPEEQSRPQSETAQPQIAPMPKYSIRVAETRTYNTTYTVEANSPEEAVENAEAGENIEEVTGSLQSINEREVISPPRLIK